MFFRLLLYHCLTGFVLVSMRVYDLCMCFLWLCICVWFSYALCMFCFLCFCMMNICACIGLFRLLHTLPMCFFWLCNVCMLFKCVECPLCLHMLLYAVQLLFVRLSHVFARLPCLCLMIVYCCVRLFMSLLYQCCICSYYVHIWLWKLHLCLYDFPLCFFFKIAYCACDSHDMRHHFLMFCIISYVFK